MNFKNLSKIINKIMFKIQNVDFRQKNICHIHLLKNHIMFYSDVDNMIKFLSPDIISL
jgi:hypothetical protein